MTNYKVPCDQYDCGDCRKKDHGCDDYRKEKDCRPVYPVTILNCGTGTGTSLPILANESNDLGFTPQVVGSVNLDTRGLDKVTKKIEFSSIINFQTREFEDDFGIVLVFQLSSVCNGGYKTPLGTWVYEKNLDIDNNNDDHTWIFRDSFSFVWCECDQCPECCKFIVEVVDFRYDSLASASITNVGISALAVGNPCYK